MARQQLFTSFCTAGHRLLSTVPTCQGARKDKAAPITPWVAFLRSSPYHPYLPQRHESTPASACRPYRFPLLLPLRSPSQLRICCCKAVSRLCEAAAGLAGLRTFASGNDAIWPEHSTWTLYLDYLVSGIWTLFICVLDKTWFEPFLLWMILYVMYVLSVLSCHSERCSIKIVVLSVELSFLLVGAAPEMPFIIGVY